MVTSFFVLLFQVLVLFSFRPLLAFTPIKEFANTDCLLTVVEQPTGEQYIVKQIRDKTPFEQLLLINDLCASEIGITCGIPLNKVSLISSGVSFPGKLILDCPATLHKVVPGISADESLPWEGFSIHQRFHRPANLERVYGKLPDDEKGLTDEVLYHMQKHPDLIKIVAFDTFVGNGDRSNPNIFYDANSNQFWGIDMAASFRSNLAKIVHTRMQNSDELKLPKAFFATLRKLHKNYPPKELNSLLINSVIKSKYFLQHHTEAWERVFRQLKNFSVNYEEVTKILDLEELMSYSPTSESRE